ncbi:hypothetical protein EJ05DRAFT_509000 [Pseudovirgaria hyperparasitica]|uniref:Nudix hydrolase domain-containing protein n=1 Tax=Pseudovirgaria hyperparasitica TaxID=470096 RepID=A0A6A6WEQ5_9PEZI|nr:uncharacterized protein EJ05DRAFT_509000 [Pseudovirgaria hyperparasitica]KAF2760470.1 hypothetical protein EJ05DRAFT_509000 [Pseudovirgaria hyperparasitica]
MPRTPGVGVGVLITRPHSTHPARILLGLRTGSIGENTWALPGGHLEFGESFTECAVREVLEETGLRLEVGSCRVCATVSTVWDDVRAEDGRAHYVTVFVTGRVSGEDEEQEARIMEPERCKEWRWMEVADVRGWALEQSRGESERGEKLFPPIVSLFTQTTYGS